MKSLLLLFLMATSSFSYALQFKELSFRQKSILTRSFDSKSPIKLLNLTSLINMPSLNMTHLRDATFFYPSTEGDQVVMPSTGVEKKLIDMSDLGSRTKEVATIMAVTDNGFRIHFHDYHTSNDAAKIESETLIEALEQFIIKLALHPLGNQVQYINIIHSHPTYEATDGESVIIAPLNAQDLLAAETISTGLSEVPVMVTAVVANGYSYHALFVGGENYSKSYFGQFTR